MDRDEYIRRFNAETVRRFGVTPAEAGYAATDALPHYDNPEEAALAYGDDMDDLTREAWMADVNASNAARAARILSGEEVV